MHAMSDFLRFCITHSCAEGLEGHAATCNTSNGFVKNKTANVRRQVGQGLHVMYSKAAMAQPEGLQLTRDKSDARSCSDSCLHL